MVKIGMVDIDTSHPPSFAQILNNGNRARVIAVCNTGFRTDEEVKKFMADTNVKTRVDKIEDMVDLVDVCFIHSCNWDKHLEKAMPFINAGKPVFIDKPIVGNLRDCHKLEELVKKGARILGGSSIRYCYEFQNFLKSMQPDEKVLSMFGACGVDEFNYGVHTYEGINSIIGNGALQVKYIGGNNTIEEYYVECKEGRQAIYQIQKEQWQPFVFVITTNKRIENIKVDNGKIYDAILDKILDYMEKGVPMVSIEELTETIKVYLSGKKSKEEGRAISLDELKETDIGYDGYAFERYYAELNKKKKE